MHALLMCRDAAGQVYIAEGQHRSAWRFPRGGLTQFVWWANSRTYIYGRDAARQVHSARRGSTAANGLFQRAENAHHAGERAAEHVSFAGTPRVRCTAWRGRGRRRGSISHAWAPLPHSCHALRILQCAPCAGAPSRRVIYCKSFYANCAAPDCAARCCISPVQPFPGGSAQRHDNFC